MSQHLPVFFLQHLISLQTSIGSHKTFSIFFSEYHFLLLKELFFCERNSFNITPLKMFQERRVQKQELSCSPCLIFILSLFPYNTDEQKTIKRLVFKTILDCSPLFGSRGENVAVDFPSERTDDCIFIMTLKCTSNFLKQ